MATDRQSLGVRGERIAAEYLKRSGLEEVLRNYRCRYGEVDLVLRQGACWVFVEVKTRRTLRLGSPAESVTPRKRSRITRAAVHFLAERGCCEDPCRFDVVEVLLLAGLPPQVRHLADAFPAALDTL